MTTPTVPSPTDKSLVKITLYWLEKSRSQRISLLLEELQLPYELKTFKRRKDKLAEESLKEIHPLGKSPVIGIQGPDQAKPKIIPESAAIIEYLCDYFGKDIVPARYPQGPDGKENPVIGSETEEFMRYRHFMHYAEGSLMTLLLITFVALQIRDGPAPFFIRPILRAIYNNMNSMFLAKNLATHFDFIESQLATSGGDYFCGQKFTAADIMMLYPLETTLLYRNIGINMHEKYPKTVAWVERMQARDAYKKAIQRIKDETGEYDPKL